MTRELTDAAKQALAEAGKPQEKYDHNARLRGGTSQPDLELDEAINAHIEIERLTRERDEWKEKWIALAQAALIVGDRHS